MANCYVFNISKYKTDDIKGIAKHNLRDLNDLSRTTNIDPSRTKTICILILMTYQNLSIL